MNVEQLATRIIAKETIEQIECDGVKPDLVKLGAIARAKGHRGFGVQLEWGKYVGVFIGADYKACGMTYASHATPEAALVALGG